MSGLPGVGAGVESAARRWDPARVALLGLVCLVAAVLRIAHLVQIAENDPFFTVPAVDGRLYDAWAQRIAQGQLMTDHVLFLGPLYPYFMALVYAIAGPSQLALKAVQCGLGVATCALVAVLAREHFDRRVALVAAAIAALYPMLIFYGGTLMVVNLQVPLVLLVLIAIARARRSPTGGRWLMAGLLLGGSALARQTTLLFAPFALFALVWTLRDPPSTSRLVKLAAVFCVGVTVPILPFTLNNYRVAQDLVLLNSTGGANLYMGNNARSTGVWAPPPIGNVRVDNPMAMRDAFAAAAEAEVGRPLAPSAISAFWSRRALDYAIDNPRAWMVLALRKLLLFLHAWEVWNNRSITVSSDFSWVLRLPLPGFAVVGPLGLLGLILCGRRLKELFPLYAMLAAYLAAALAFFVLSRYRMPAVAVLMVFAAVALVHLWDAAARRDWKPLALAVAGLAALVVLVNLPLKAENLYMAYYNLGNKYKSLSRWQPAIASYKKSLERNAGFVSTYNNLALAYEGAGEAQNAIEAWRLVLAISTQSGDSVRRERALRHLQSLGAPPPAKTEAAEHRGRSGSD